MDSSTPGRVDGIPKFKRAGEPWLECPICGFDYPRSEMVRNYRTNKLVDMKCDDQLTHDDYLQIMERRKERMEPTEQQVQNQGAQTFTPFGAGDPGIGAGEGGAGTGT